MNTRKRKSVDCQEEKLCKIVRVDSGYDSESPHETDHSEEEINEKTETKNGEKVMNEDRDIVTIKSEKITTAEQWKKLTDHVTSDHHETVHRAQLRYIPEDSRVKPDSFLMVGDDGNVTTNGKENDERTLFDIVHNYTNGKYRLICKGGPCTDYILYMDYDQLKARKMKMRESQDVQVSTLFNFTSKDNREIPPWKISSYSGVPLTFGNNGKYINTPQSDCYSFYAYVAYTMKISAV